MNSISVRCACVNHGVGLDQVCVLEIGINSTSIACLLEENKGMTLNRSPFFSSLSLFKLKGLVNN